MGEKAIETVYNILRSRGYAMEIPYGEKAVTAKWDSEEGSKIAVGRQSPGWSWYSTITGTQKRMVFEYVSYKIRRKKDEWNSFLAGGIAGLSMLFQRSSTLALYVLSKVGEVLYFRGAQKGYLPWFKNGDVFLYTVCTAVMFHAAVLEPHNLNPTYWRFLSNLTNKRFGEMNRKRLDPFGLESSRCFPDFDPFPLKKMEH
eukprot:gene17148-8683_t